MNNTIEIMGSVEGYILCFGYKDSSINQRIYIPFTRFEGMEAYVHFYDKNTFTGSYNDSRHFKCEWSKFKDSRQNS